MELRATFQLPAAPGTYTMGLRLFQGDQVQL
jgi:hypothetical protein